MSVAQCAHCSENYEINQRLNDGYCPDCREQLNAENFLYRHDKPELEQNETWADRYPTDDFYLDGNEICPDCDGVGDIEETCSECSTCGGDGYV